MSVLLSTAIASNLFHGNKELKTYTLDGEQHFFASLIASRQLDLLRIALEQTKIPLPGSLFKAGDILVVTKFVTMIAVMSVSAGMGDEVPGEELLQAIPRAAMRHAVGLAARADSYVNSVLDHTGLVVKVASLVSFVAIIYFGNPIAGGIGLFGIALTMLKEGLYLPSSLDSAVSLIAILSQPLLLWLSPMSLLMRTLFMMDFLNTVISGLFTTPCFSHLFKKHHTWTAPTSLDLPTNGFEINWHSLHSPYLDRLSPAVVVPEGTNKGQVLDAIEARASRLKIQYERDGWKNIKTFILTGRSADATPNSGQDLRELLFTSIWQIYNEKSDVFFSEALTRTSNEGMQCAEGWFANIKFAVAPETETDIGRVVHPYLAQLRSEVLNRALQEVIKDCPTVFDGVGQSNNIHLLTQFGMMLHERWRCSDVEIANRLNPKPRGLFQDYLFRSLDRPHSPQEVMDQWIALGCSIGEQHKLDQQDPSRSQMRNRLNLLQRFVMGAQPPLGDMARMFLPAMRVTLPIAPRMVVFVGLQMDLLADESYTSETVVQSIHDAIQPSYLQVEEEGRVAYQAIRQIPWQPIQTWLSDTARGLAMGAEELEERCVTRDYNGTPSLNKTGVQMLLWDLGIIQPRA